MKISNREKKLIAFLIIFILLAGIYKLVIEKQELQNQSLEAELIQKQSDLSSIEKIIATESTVDAKIQSYGDDITALANYFYGEISQEEIVFLLDNLAKDTNFEIRDMRFDELVSEDGTQSLMVTVKYQGTYTDLQYYIERLKNESKLIVINQITANRNELESTDGEVEIEFTGLPTAKNFIVAEYKNINDSSSNLNTSMNPFESYEGFIIESETANTQDEGTPTEIVPTMVKKLVYDFEDMRTFFVGEPEDVTGSISQSTLHVSGNFAAEIVYDFKSSKKINRANLIIDREDITIDKQPQLIGIWVYTYEASTHHLGVVVTDSAGKDHDIKIVSQLDTIGWQEIEVPMPINITYPCAVKRIYVASTDYDSKLNGRIVIDHLEIAFPIEN